MGKNLVQQARGHGGPTYRAPSFRYAGKISHRTWSAQNIKGNVIDLLKCPGHSAPLMVIEYEDGDRNLTVAPEGIRVGDEVVAGPTAPIGLGNTVQLQNLPEGALVHNLEASPGDGGKFVRTSGGAGRIVTKMTDKIIVKMPSLKNREFHPACRASLGIIGGSGRTEKPFMRAGTKHFHMKAKNKLWPKTSGGAQNAVDHPFGNKRTQRKSKARPAPRNAPPGRKVGMIRPPRSGRKR
ncbi:TPA: 50S ribosomal protein L2 [Candidatus Woesearchaeota archaeon]|nr:50S ribosomal protein L2P [uncultured archaeon]AJS12097.1 large subunit ribosomal protein L2 [uncultured archaeon]KHO51185.1 MAG: large subunit ribosomal protein L2 [archaeon GW2011_AR16]HIG96379.1 50S ribosomal protein L2 [Candidatus Woesearchaeota archaeon]